MKQYSVYIQNLYIHTHATLGAFHKELKIVCGCSKGYGSSAITICCFQGLHTWTLKSFLTGCRQGGLSQGKENSCMYYSHKICVVLTVKLISAFLFARRSLVIKI